MGKAKKNKPFEQPVADKYVGIGGMLRYFETIPRQQQEEEQPQPKKRGRPPKNKNSRNGGRRSTSPPQRLRKSPPEQIAAEAEGNKDVENGVVDLKLHRQILISTVLFILASALSTNVNQKFGQHRSSESIFTPPSAKDFVYS